jgi:hypothetical protein
MVKIIFIDIDKNGLGYILGNFLQTHLITLGSSSSDSGGGAHSKTFTPSSVPSRQPRELSYEYSLPVPSGQFIFCFAIKEPLQIRNVYVLYKIIIHVPGAIIRQLLGSGHG